jgi:hypothetical protein
VPQFLSHLTVFFPKVNLRNVGQLFCAALPHLRGGPLAGKGVIHIWKAIRDEQLAFAVSDAKKKGKNPQNPNFMYQA